MANVTTLLTASDQTVTELSIETSSATGATTTTAGMKAAASQAASSTAVLTRLICYGIMGVINAIGNSINIAAVAMTPRLQTKTNCILASLMVAELSESLLLFEYVAVNGFVLANGGSCKYNVLVAANWTIQKASIYMYIAGGM